MWSEQSIGTDITKVTMRLTKSSCNDAQWLIDNTPCKTKAEVVAESLTLARFLREKVIDGCDILTRSLDAKVPGSANIYGALYVIKKPELGI